MHLAVQVAAASASAAGDSPGVFVGISYNEYAQISAAAAPSVSTYTATGGSLSVAAGMTYLRLPPQYNSYITLV